MELFETKMMNDIKEIRRRHKAVTGYFADEKGTAAHWDRGWLLEYIEELEAEVERLRLKFADITDGTCPVCNHSLDADDLWLCENCGWREVGDE